VGVGFRGAAGVTMAAMLRRRGSLAAVVFCGGPALGVGGSALEMPMALNLSWRRGRLPFRFRNLKLTNHSHHGECVVQKTDDRGASARKRRMRERLGFRLEFVRSSSTEAEA
jgi:hypothetical protein